MTGDVAIELQLLVRRRLEDFSAWEAELEDLELILDLFPYAAEPGFLRKERP